MYRVSNKLALLACAVAVAACSGQSKTNPADTSGGNQGQTGLFYSVVVSMPTGGKVTGGGIDCGMGATACSANVLWADSVTLNHVEMGSNTFVRWAGDCTGAGSCILTNGADKTVAAIFAGTEGGASQIPSPPNDTTPGRVYGFVRDGGGLAAAGVKIFVDPPLPFTGTSAVAATSSATGTFAIDMAPGVHSLFTASTPAYNNAGPYSVTVPAIGTGTAADGSLLNANPACNRGFYQNSPYRYAGCLVPTDIIVGATGAPVTAPPTVNAPVYLAGFGTNATLTCVGTVPSGGSWRWVQVSGPTDVSTQVSARATGSDSFATPSIPALQAATVAADPACVPNLADPTEPICTPSTLCPAGAGYSFANPGGNSPIGCGVSNFYFENRPRLIPIMKQQASDMTYVFECQLLDASSAVAASTRTSVQLASAVNANPGNFVQNPPAIATGAPRIPAGVIVIADDYRICATGQTTSLGVPCRTGAYNWTATITTTLTGLTTPLPPQPGAAVQNPWFRVPTVPATNTSAAPLDSIALTFANTIGASYSVTAARSWTAFDNSCHQCHGSPTNPSINQAGGAFVGGNYNATPEVVDEWKGSKHNQIVRDGMSTTHYSKSCFACHTVGYDLGVTNGGFDEVAAAASYSLPDFTFLGTNDQVGFGLMPAPVQAMANVQCQNCHGPAISSTAGVSSAFPQARAHSASASADVCGQCHTELFTQWRTSGHGNLAGAQAEGPGNPASYMGHCTRCHDAQGNQMYRTALLAGVPDRFANRAPGALGATITIPAGNVSKGIRPPCSPSYPATTCSTPPTNGNVTVTVTLPAGTVLPQGTPAVNLTFVAPDVGTIVTPATTPAPGPFTSGVKIITVAANGQSFTYLEAALGTDTARVTTAAVTGFVVGFPTPTGMTADNVEAITCQTCHNPHSLELNITDADTQGAGLLLAGGFRISNAGAGALCASCHNSRNGMVGGSATVAPVAMQHNDATPLRSDTFGMTAPHAASQADVYFQGNGYLFGATVARANFHKDNLNFFQDTCVACHVKRFNTETDGKSGVNHNFGVDENTCVSCHGAGSELQTRERYVEDRLGNSPLATPTAGTQPVGVYQLVLAQVLNGAGITGVGRTQSVAAGSVSKANLGSIVSVNLTNHGYISGTPILVALTTADVAPGPAVSAWFKNGSFTITVVDANTFTYDDGQVSTAGSTIATSGATSYTGSYSVVGLGAITKVAVGGDRPLTLDLTFGSTLFAGINIDYVVSGTTPTLFVFDMAAAAPTYGTLRPKIYGTVAKTMYNYALIKDDNSYGVHNIPFVDAMLGRMISKATYPIAAPF